MLKKKKKSSESSSKSNRSKASSSSLFSSTYSCNSTLSLIVVSIVIMICYSWYMLGSTNSSFIQYIKSEATIEQQNFHELLEKAHALALKYRNLTGALPDDHHSVLSSVGHTVSSTSSTPSSNLRRPDIAQIKMESLGKAKQQQSVSLSSTSSSITTSSPAKTEGKKDIMIGIAQEMDPKNFAVFCISFREVNTKADLVIFVNSPIPDRLVSIAAENDVTLLEYNLRTLDSGMSSFHPSTIRWPLIAKYFQALATREKYARVWMADVRDTYFQSDPFDMLPLGERGFLAFTGVDISIGSCGWNSGWIKDCFGDGMVGTVGINKIICSGVSMGDMDSVYEYLQAFDDIVSNKKMTDLGRRSKFPQCERNGVDQGVHNVLVYQGRIPNLKILNQKTGPVANMQSKLGRITNFQVSNLAGQKYAVVHQYDREPTLQAHLFKQYVTWVDTSDPFAEWRQENACKGFLYEENNDLFKGICDSRMKGGMTGPASCCDVCLKTDGCSAFTFYQGTCFFKNCATRRGNNRLEGAVSAWKSA